MNVINKKLMYCLKLEFVVDLRIEINLMFVKFRVQSLKIIISMSKCCWHGWKIFLTLKTSLANRRNETSSGMVAKQLGIRRKNVESH